MSVIEDALRRAELQGRSTPPRSVGKAVAVVRPAVITPPPGKSAPHASKPRTAIRNNSRAADPRFSKPSEPAAPRRRWGAMMLMAVVMSIVFGHLLLDALTELPAWPVNGIAMDDSIAVYASTGMLASYESPAGLDVRRPIAIDAANLQSPERVRDRAPKVTQPVVDRVAQDAQDAAPIESINQRFHVTGVMVSAGKRLAVINDVVVGLGDRVDGAIVRAIDARGVIIEVDGERHHAPVTVRGRN